MQLELGFITGGKVSQRWHSRRERFLPPTVRFNPSICEVVELPEADAKTFVCQHHYAASMPPARLRIGLMVKAPFREEFLGGVAVFSVPMQPAAVPKYLGVAPAAGVELGRLVLLDDPDTLGFNAESYFVSQAMRILRRRLPEVRGFVSYCDPVPRYASDGTQTKPGHVGTVYRALSANFHGRGSRRTLVVASNGQVVSERSLSKIRLGETGADYAMRQLAQLGAPNRLPFEDGRTYVDRVLACGVFRKVSHPGNFVFSFNL